MTKMKLDANTTENGFLRTEHTPFQEKFRFFLLTDCLAALVATSQIFFCAVSNFYWSCKCFVIIMYALKLLALIL